MNLVVPEVRWRSGAGSPGAVIVLTGAEIAPFPPAVTCRDAGATVTMAWNKDDLRGNMGESGVIGVNVDPDGNRTVVTPRSDPPHDRPQVAGHIRLDEACHELMTSRGLVPELTSADPAIVSVLVVPGAFEVVGVAPGSTTVTVSLRDGAGVTVASATIPVLIFP